MVASVSIPSILYDATMIAPRSRLAGTELDFYPLTALPKAGLTDPSGLSMTVKVLIEGLVRLSEHGVTREENVGALAAWPAPPPERAELPFLPARVLMQDFTGVPAVVDLAAMRSAIKRQGGTRAGSTRWSRST